MLNFIYSQLLFYFAIAIILFIPGYFLLLAVFGKSKTLSALENFVFSFGLGIIVTDFIAFFYDKISVSITATSSILGALFFSIICFVIYKFKNKRNHYLNTNLNNDKNNLFSFSKNQIILIFLLLFLTIFLRTAYLDGTVAPTATDMGHHMYWVEYLNQTHHLPDYEGMPDFIIGEHIIFSEISMISGLSVFSAFPVVLLFLINILGILSVFLLTLRVFKSKNVAIFTLLFLGVLFAVSSPQAKFISGGVIGNIMGNFFIPMAFYFYYRAFSAIGESLPTGQTGASSGKFINNLKIVANTSLPRNNSPESFLSLGIFSTFGLFYTHHLSAFIFLFVTFFLIIWFLAINYKNIRTILKNAGKIIFSLPVLTTFILSLVFFFFIFTPTYIDGSAVETAIGSPEKSTRLGMSLAGLKSSVGEPKMALGIIGLIALLLNYKKRNFGFAIFFSWMIMLFIMSTRPNLLFIDLPSSRIANYITYPTAILAAYGLFSLFEKNIKNILPKKLFSGAFILTLIFVLAYGLEDSTDAIKKSPDFSNMIQTFSLSKYLSQKTSPEDILLKDHNYIAASDTWMKLFFLRGYRYPLSRSYFKRYEDLTNPRELCTLYMISKPGTDEGKECFSETLVDLIAINPRYDSAQFKKLPDFDAVYVADEVAAFYRK